MVPTSLTSFCVVATLFGAGISVRVGDDEADSSIEMEKTLRTNVSQTFVSSDQIAILDTDSASHECFKNDYESTACCKRPDYGSPCKSSVLIGNHNLFWGGQSQCVIYDLLLECLSESSDIKAGKEFSPDDKESCLANMFADPKSMSKEDIATCCAGATAEGIQGWRVKENATLQSGRRWAGVSMLNAFLGDINLEFIHSAELGEGGKALVTALNGRTLWKWITNRKPQEPKFTETLYVGLLVSVIRALAKEDIGFAVSLKGYLKTAVKVVGGVVAIGTLVGTTIVTFGGTAPLIVPSTVAAALAILGTANAVDSVADATEEIQNVDRLYDEIYCHNEKPAPRRDAANP